MATDLVLYIPSIEINGFKSLKHLKIDLFGSINLLTGDNDVGKFTLLEALVLFRIAGERMNCFESRLEDDNLTSISAECSTDGLSACLIANSWLS